MSPSRWFRVLCWGGALGLLAVALGAPAVLADDYRRSVKDIPQPFSWTGLYIGAHAGLVTGETTGEVGLGSVRTDYSLDGAIYGGQIGYNYQRGWSLFGIEATWSGANVQGNTPCVVVLDCRRDINSIGSVVGRLGLAVDRSLLYAMGGVAWGDVDTHVRIVGTPLLSGSETQTGWTAGFGLEHAFTERISTRIEYAHIDLGSETQNLKFTGGIVPAIPDKVDARMDTLRLGVNLKLTN